MGRIVRSLLWACAVIALFLGLMRMIAIRWWRIPEEDVYLNASVSPTLRGGDLIVLWRLTPPDRGDLVMCPEPNHPERSVIGRVLGEEGEKIKIQGTRASVDDRAFTVETDCDEPLFTENDPQTGIEQEQKCALEVVGGRTHQRGSADSKVAPPTVEAEVPQGHVYLVSDNRQFPYDSREYGPVERASCKETVVFRVFGGAGLGDPDSRFTFIR